MSDEVRIWCDRCGAVIAAPQEEMGEALDDNGWTADDFGDFTCGTCREDNQSDFWDGTTPLGGDDMDGK